MRERERERELEIITLGKIEIFFLSMGLFSLLGNDIHSITMSISFVRSKTISTTRRVCVCDSLTQIEKTLEGS